MNDNNINKMYAPVDGSILTLKDVPDKLFSNKMVGDGAAVNPTSDIICAPISGTLSIILKGNHAFCIKTTEGIHVVVHIGIDTVKLKGTGFTKLTEAGIYVRPGDPIIKMDSNFIISKGFSLITVVVITDNVEIKSIQKNKIVKSGIDPMYEFCPYI